MGIKSSNERVFQLTSVYLMQAFHADGPTSRRRVKSTGFGQWPPQPEIAKSLMCRGLATLRESIQYASSIEVELRKRACCVGTNPDAAQMGAKGLLLARVSILWQVRFSQRYTLKSKISSRHFHSSIFIFESSCHISTRSNLPCHYIIITAPATPIHLDA